MQCEGFLLTVWSGGFTFGPTRREGPARAVREVAMNARTRWSRWPTAALVARSAAGRKSDRSAVVQAATAGLVRLEGGGSSHLAKVDASGQLSVNPGLTQTGRAPDPGGVCEPDHDAGDAA